MDLKLNFVGLLVEDFNRAFRFYTEVLGMVARHSRPGWAYFETTGAIFEMFQGDALPSSRWQSVVPTLAVSHLQEVAKGLRGRGVSLLDRDDTAEGLTFADPDGRAWYLTDDGPGSAGLEKPRISRFTLACEQIDAQSAFYRDVMLMQLTSRQSDRTLFTQDEGDPTMVLRNGGRARVRVSDRTAVPHYISFETDDITQAAEWLRTQNADFMQDVAQKPWGGVDLYVRDADNNPVQVVQYKRDQGLPSLPGHRLRS